MELRILSLSKIVVKSLIAMGFCQNVQQVCMLECSFWISMNLLIKFLSSLFFLFHFTSIFTHNNPNSKVLMNYHFSFIEKRMKDKKLMNVNEKLTHIKFLIIIESLFLSYNKPDTCKPMSDERKAHLLNEMMKILF